MDDAVDINEHELSGKSDDLAAPSFLARAIYILLFSVALARAIYILLFSVALAIVIHLYKKISSIERNDHVLSLRGEIISHFLTFLSLYVISWLPILAIGIYDGELETASLSEGVKGQMANIHCALQDLIERSFCVSIIITAAVYYKYCNTEISEACCTGRPNIFLWGWAFPVLFVEVIRNCMEQLDWLLATPPIIKLLHDTHFFVTATVMICVQKMDESWIRQVSVEWFVSMIMIAIACFSCAPCYYHEMNNSKSKVKGDLEQGSNLKGSNTSDVQSLISLPSNTFSDSQPLKAESKGLYARGKGFLETVFLIGVLWAAILRPFMAVGLYVTNTGVFSNQLELPTHVLMIFAIVLLSAEIDPKNKEGIEDEENSRDSREKIGSQVPNVENDVPPLIIEERDETRGANAQRGNNDDVEAIWKDLSDTNDRILRNMKNEEAVSQTAIGNRSQ